MLPNVNPICVLILINVALAKCASIDIIKDSLVTATPSSTTSTLVTATPSSTTSSFSSSDDKETGSDSDSEEKDLRVSNLAKRTGVLWKRIRQLLAANATARQNPELGRYVSVDEPENGVEEGRNLLGGRQFVFHPFLPYGKEVKPDEKITFHDVLPIKMVKFIKDMVEEAPWEQMFMKMVRMVVDQFVEKIIEKMFAHHDDEHDDKWRSFDGRAATSTGNGPPKLPGTTVVRQRRSSKRQDKQENGFRTEKNNRLSKGDKAKETGTNEESWLDSLLEYLFPEDTKTDLREEKTKTKRSLDAEDLDVPEILNVFFVKLYELETGKKASERLKSKLRNEVHRQILSSVAKFAPNSWITFEEDDSAARSRRSVDDRESDPKRLWQDNRKTRPVTPRGECSLRRACNTGRLLARLPSVKDITLQLKSYAKEPHWDALVWGMAKKKCSKIFCKRQRSPKGSKHRWDLEEKRLYRNNAASSTRSPKRNHKDHESISSLLRYE